MKKLLKTTVASALALACVAAWTPANADQIINLHSGNGSVGGTDSAVSMLVGPLEAPFGSAFTGTDFANARAGTAASIVGNHSAWISSTTFNLDPSTPNDGAQWISTNASASHPTFGNGASALFAIDFTITDAIISSASIDFDFAVDNAIGNSFGGPNEGLFLNGVALSGSTSGSGFGSVLNISRSDIASLLITGTNTLYINMTDVGGPSGLIFSATIATEGSTTVAVPEPGLIAIFALGIAGIGFGRWAHNRRV